MKEVKQGSELDVMAGVVDVLVLAPAADGVFPDRWRVLTLRRATGTRCTGAWEMVHGRIEAGESAEDAARREVMEETGFPVERLYYVTVNPFFMPVNRSVQLAMVFVAVLPLAVAADGSSDLSVRLSEEHDMARWLNASEAMMTLAWPSEHEAIRQAMWILRSGDAGPVEDVLLVRP